MLAKENCSCSHEIGEVAELLPRTLTSAVDEWFVWKVDQFKKNNKSRKKNVKEM